MRRRLLVPILLAGALVAACSDSDSSSAPATNGQTFTGSAAERSAEQQEQGGFTVHEVATLNNPWAMTFIPGADQLLITQQSGALLLRDQKSGETAQVEGTPEVVFAGQGGLGDVVLSPDFAQDRLVYLSWVEEGPGGTGAAVGRGRLETDSGSASLVDFTRIWEQSPKQSGSGHFSHRMAFSPDGQYLFVTSGDRQKLDPAQDLDGGLGKVLRLTPDGTPAAGNPFADRGGVAAQSWTYGHRNPLGIAFAPDGTLWSSEMGPRGGDELNAIVKGSNYGWPEASNGSHYDGRSIPDHAPGDGFVPPQASWTPSVSPGSLMIYTGDAWPQWKGHAFIGALSGQALIRVELDGATAFKADQWDMGARIREVEQAPDGTIWLLEDGDSARLLQLTPAS